MVENLKGLAQEFKQRGHPEMADYLNKGAKIARELGVPESFPVSAAVTPVEVNPLQTSQAPLVPEPLFRPNDVIAAGFPSGRRAPRQDAGDVLRKLFGRFLELWF